MFLTIKKLILSRSLRWFFPLISLTILALTFAPAAMASEGISSVNGETGKPVDLNGLTPADIEKLYPMSAQEEAAIIHTIPSCPVIIDGVRYEGNQISLFNGKRLRFITGSDGNFYAFTTVEGLEKFQSQRPVNAIPQAVQLSTFYVDWWFSGLSFNLSISSPQPALYYPFDNAISSVKVGTDVSWAYLFDYANYGGDYYGMQSGSEYSMLVVQGWNDRASSIWLQ